MHDQYVTTVTGITNQVNQLSPLLVSSQIKCSLGGLHRRAGDHGIGNEQLFR